MERFIDLEQEMDTLQSKYERKGSALVILCGRRTAQIRLGQIPFRYCVFAKIVFPG